MRTTRATRTAVRIIHSATSLGTLVLAAAACGDSGRSAPGGAGESATAAPGRDTTAGAAAPVGGDTLATHLVQLAALSDSGRAAALADSLAGAGWTVRVEPAVAGGAGVFRVQLPLAGGEEMARHVAHALRTAGREATVGAAGSGVRAPRRAVYVVNRGTHGMLARARWAFSPDQRTVLAVEDATAVENDPLPNGFLLAGPRGLTVHRDSVWDVAPSPDWTRLAYSRAYVTPPGERESLTPLEWERFAARAGLEVSTVRRAAFPTSGMNYALGVGRPFVMAVAPIDGGDTVAHALPVADGWRLRWTRDGARLVVGLPPRQRISDDADASSWRVVHPVTGADLGTASVDSLAVIAWVTGPTLDISVPVDSSERRLPIASGLAIESRGGWIRVRGAAAAARGSTGGAQPSDARGVIVGPGVALAATADGSLIVALAPNPDARTYEATHHLVVYRIPT